jgi:membrane protein required for colicin V production
MTLFDIIAAGVIGVSALIGFSRGAVRELVGLLAFAVSAFAAIFFLPLTGNIARALVHPALAATVLAVVGGFAVVYLGFKLIGHLLATRLHQETVLGGVDRALGLGIGAGRALIVLGLFALVFDRATPARLRPDWITGAFLYPLASASGRMLGSVAPAGLRAAGEGVAPLLNGAVGEGARDTAPSEQKAVDGQTATPSTNSLVKPSRAAHKSANGTQGYGKHARDSVDALVEKTR